MGSAKNSENVTSGLMYGKLFVKSDGVSAGSITLKTGQLVLKGINDLAVIGKANRMKENGTIPEVIYPDNYVVSSESGSTLEDVLPEDTSSYQDLPKGSLPVFYNGHLTHSWQDYAFNRPGQSLTASVPFNRSNVEKGKSGEKATGRALELLGLPWRVLHSVPLSASGKDLDHLVFGPAGVFAINSKLTPQKLVTLRGSDEVLVDGRKTNWLARAAQDAAHVSSVLSPLFGAPVQVLPLICISGADSVKESRGFPVISVNNLVSALSSAVEVVDESSIEVLFNIARRSDSWT